MPSLRDYRDRIKSVKSTKKITSAMKMVAASKLRRAQEQAQASQPYAQSMSEILARLARGVTINASSPKLLAGTGKSDKHLLLVVTADRGLCGGFNANVAKETRQRIRDLTAQGKQVSIVCVGRKGRDNLNRDYGRLIGHTFRDVYGKNRVDFVQAHKISEYLLAQYEAGAFDVCTLIYSQFQSVLVQKPTGAQLIPFRMEAAQSESKQAAPKTKSPYEFEPSEEEILAKLLPRNLGVQIFRALLDSAAGEQAARMTAMDSATRNAGEMIKDLTLKYNRARQAYITKELIEIISGAEAV